MDKNSDLWEFNKECTFDKIRCKSVRVYIVALQLALSKSHYNNCRLTPWVSRNTASIKVL